MNSSLTTTVILDCLSSAILLGMIVRRRLPEQHVSADAKETVKQPMVLMATMAEVLFSKRPEAVSHQVPMLKSC